MKRLGNDPLFNRSAVILVLEHNIEAQVIIVGTVYAIIDSAATRLIFKVSEKEKRSLGPVSLGFA